MGLSKNILLNFNFPNDRKIGKKIRSLSDWPISSIFGTFEKTLLDGFSNLRSRTSAWSMLRCYNVRLGFFFCGFGTKCLVNGEMARQKTPKPLFFVITLDQQQHNSHNTSIGVLYTTSSLSPSGTSREVRLGDLSDQNRPVWWEKDLFDVHSHCMNT